MFRDCSFSKKIDSIKIWDVHAQGGTGFAIAYDHSFFAEIPNIGADMVTYETDFLKRPKIKITDLFGMKYDRDRMIELIKIKYFWKRNSYSWEHEYRVFLRDYNNEALSHAQRTHVLSRGIKRIFLGYNMDQSVKEYILAFSRICLKGVEVLIQE
jgi:hypothetical protein